MNKTLFIGRLTRDPEASEIKTKSGDTLAKARITLAIDRAGTYGENKKTDFIPITVFGKQAESVNKYLAKGRQVAVEAHVQTGSYEKDGKTVYTTDFMADRVEFLGSGSGRDMAKEAETKMKEEIPDSMESAEEDIPF